MSYFFDQLVMEEIKQSISSLEVPHRIQVKWYEWIYVVEYIHKTIEHLITPGLS